MNDLFVDFINTLLQLVRLTLKLTLNYVHCAICPLLIIPSSQRCVSLLCEYVNSCRYFECTYDYIWTNYF